MVVAISLQQAGLLLGACLILLSSAAGLRSQIWPAALHGLGIAAGTLLLASLVLPAPFYALGPLLTIAYAAWLAVQFARSGPTP